MNIEQKFHDEIEVEQLWVVTEHGKYVFFSMLLVSSILVFGLWQSAPHRFLLFWFFLLTLINFCKWLVLRFYYTHKSVLTDNIRQFKRVIFAGALLTGCCWGLCVFWFLQPAHPDNVLIISVTLVIEIVGAMLTWTCYLPAVVAISLPPAVPLVSMIFMQGGNTYIATALILSILTMLGMSSSVKLAKSLNHALLLNFENLALRQESETKSLLLETALENMGQGISMSDSNGQLRMWNRQFVDLLGAIGAKVSMNADLSALLNAANPPLQVLADQVSAYRLPDGRVYEVRQSRLDQGGWVLTYADISGLVKREQALEKARKQAVQANAAKTRFLAAASHDLRQPIHALGLFFAELSDRVYGPETAQLIGQVEDSIAAINSMLNALLDISKLDAGVIKPIIGPYALTELFARLHIEFQAIALEHHNQLRIRPSPAIVNTDPAMLERILRNLIGNALRYTEHGRVLVAARPRGQDIEIQVWDNGLGIPEDQFEEIFVEFHQLQNSARDRCKGLGLGLAIVKRLADLLRHKVKISSSLGRGSCFSIFLPTASVTVDAQYLQLQDRVNRANNSLAGRQVLVMDDDIAILNGMQGLLGRWGCEVITAMSLAQAEQKLASGLYRPTLLIIDYRLPGHLSGIEVAGKLQQGLGYPSAVLIITGDTEPERLREADGSAYPLLHKPVQPAKLRSTIQYLLSRLKVDPG